MFWLILGLILPGKINFGTDANDLPTHKIAENIKNM
jgi:hypothetical protein